MEVDAPSHPEGGASAFTMTTTSTSVDADGAVTVVKRTKPTKSTKTTTAHTRSLSHSPANVPKVVPPFYTHVPRRCSWEEGYDFTPKIHPYRNVQGVVRRSWMKPPTTSATETTNVTDSQALVAPRSPSQKEDGAHRRSRRTPQRRPPWDHSTKCSSTRSLSSASRTSGRAAASSPASSASRTASARSPTPATAHRAVTTQGPSPPTFAAINAAVASTRARDTRHPSRPAQKSSQVAAELPDAPAKDLSPRPQQQRPQRPSSAKPPTSTCSTRTRPSKETRTSAAIANAADWGSAEVQDETRHTDQPHRTTTAVPAPHDITPSRPHAPRPFRSAPAAFVPLPSSPQPPTSADNGATAPRTSPRRASASLSRYQPRTCAAYTLPPDYAMQSWTLEQHAQPDVVVTGTARHRWGDPAEPHTLYLNRHLRQRTRHALLHAYSAEARRYREDRYRRGLASARELHRFLDDETEDAHNFNFAAGADLFLDNEEDVAAYFYAKEARMRARLVEGVAPLAQVMSAVSESETVQDERAEDGAPRPRTITAVLDDGHACSPILLQTTHNAHMLAETLGARDGTAVLVRPCTERELPATWGDVRATERSRVLPKGREWDRQHAIKLAVGTTTQEAIIDLLIDPRYRRPGEYLRQRRGGAHRQYAPHPFST